MTSRWSGDSSITWGIGLVAVLREPIARDVVMRRLDETLLEFPQLAPAYAVGGDPSLTALVSASFDTERLRIAVTGDEITLAGSHEAVDGLGLVALLARLTGLPLESGARGLADRPPRPFARAAAARLAEAAFAPPAVISPTGDVRTGEDVVAVTRVSGSPRTVDLVAAATAAVRRRQPDARRIAVAVGASRRPGAGATPTDDSAYLRLRNTEKLSVSGIEAALRSQPAEPAPGRTGGNRLVARVAALLSRRLGSTLLVSHLGEVAAPGVESLAFYPVTGGRSGVSIGAATVAGTTTLTIRARGGEHTGADLAELLGEVRSGLG